MKRALLICAVVLTLGVSACGSSGGSETCDFDISDFTNGASAADTTSIWNCQSSSGQEYTFAFYDDGTGVSSALGAFTWSDAGCRAVDVVAANGTNQVRDIEGSIASGIGTFRQIGPSGTEVTASCTLQIL